jgi:predicted unusual protein kinase regulating ubiquinone biosynthesis (AarF/ABC1/UbiB family)
MPDMHKRLLQKLDPKSDGAARDWVAIYDECSRILYEEIDYRMEAAYAEEFAANFSEVPWVKVPAIKRSLLAPNVLVMEYVPGVLQPHRNQLGVIRCINTSGYAQRYPAWLGSVRAEMLNHS